MFIRHRNKTRESVGDSYPTQYVETGSYIVSTQKKMVLETILGSCVGVALWDREAGVGGMIHLLLPYAGSIDEYHYPERYASTGFPVFVDALCNLGAKHNRMQASVAGGALVGPISANDINMDIGGQIMDVVEKYLAEDSVPVTKLETGGYLGCRLRLNLWSWNCEILPALDAPSAQSDLKGPPLDSTIELDLRSIKPIPQMALRIVRTMQEPDFSIREVADQVGRDQVLSARLLDICNSPMFSSVQQIDSIERAIGMMGERRMTNLVMSALMHGFLAQAHMGYSLTKGGLYRHSIGSAMVSEKLAKFTDAVDPAVAYLAGLLHDIGKVALDQHIAERYPLFYRGMQVNGERLLELERRYLGIDHSMAGMRLAREWNFPDNLCDAIAFHHQPEEAKADPALANLVNLADTMMNRFSPGMELTYLDEGITTERFDSLGLNRSQLLELVDLMPQVVFSV